MSSVTSAVATQVALTQARVQTEIAAELMEVAKDVGSPARVLQIVKATVESAALTMNAAVEAGRVDLYA